MRTLSNEIINDYRQKTYRLDPQQKLANIEDAADFVRERGFIHFWPIKGVELPSLWTAVAGFRPVADAHDDPGHITWGWKDGALGKRIWYYAKILRKKATMIDLEIVPYFYALSENFGDPDEDVRIAYHEGRLTSEAKNIFEFIFDNGPVDTIALRRGIHMTSKESNYRFDRAITQLQADFKILPVGISDSGAWRYAFIYDLVHRYYPEIPETARHIKENDARYNLAKLYILSLGAVQYNDVAKIFRWSKADLEKTISQLVEDGTVINDVKLGGTPGHWLVLREIL